MGQIVRLFFIIIYKHKMRLQELTVLIAITERAPVGDLCTDMLHDDEFPWGKIKESWDYLEEMEWKHGPHLSEPIKKLKYLYYHQKNEYGINSYWWFDDFWNNIKTKLSDIFNKRFETNDDIYNQFNELGCLINEKLDSIKYVLDLVK